MKRQPDASHEAYRIPLWACHGVGLHSHINIEIYGVTTYGSRRCRFRSRVYFRMGLMVARHVAPRGYGLSKLSIMGFHAKHL